MHHTTLSQTASFEKFAQEAAASIAQQWVTRMRLKLPERSIEKLTDAIWDCLFCEEPRVAVNA